MRPCAHFALALTLSLGVAACSDSASAPDGVDASADTGEGGDDGGARRQDGGTPGPVPAVPDEVRDHAGDWPLPNRDYDNTRAVPDAAITSESIDRLEEQWRLPLERTAPFGYITAPVLVLGELVLAQDMGGHVYAVERATGEPRWVYRQSGSTVGPNGVAVGWGKVFAGIGDTGIIALSLEDGAPLWRFEPELISSEGVDITPLPHGGRVYVSTVPASLRGAYLGGSRGILHALDQASGESLWQFDTVASDDLWGDPDQNAGGGAWYPPLIDTESGISYWGTGNPAPWPGIEGAPSGASRPGDNLYTSSVLAIDAESGELGWYHQERPHDLFDWDFQASPVRVRPAQDGDPDLVVGAGKVGTVVGLDPRSGELRFRTEVGLHENDDLQELPTDESIVVLPGVFGGVLSPLAYADGLIFAPVVNMATGYSGTSWMLTSEEPSGELVAIDARDGSIRWSAALAAPCYAGATVSGDLVLTADANGRVSAHAVADGGERWHYQAPAGINAPLTVAGDTLLIPAGVSPDGGQLVALKLSEP